MPQDLVRRSPNPTCDGDTPTTATGGRLWLPAPLVICSILRACQVFIEATVAAGRRGLVVWLAACVLRAPAPSLREDTTRHAPALPFHATLELELELGFVHEVRDLVPSSPRLTFLRHGTCSCHFS